MMTEQELEHSRELYKHYVQQREEYISLKKEIASLEKNPTVKLYLELIEKRSLYDKSNLLVSDKVMAERAFLGPASRTVSSNKIMFYIGSHLKDGMYSSRLVAYDNLEIDYRVYLDLENQHVDVVSISDCENFERENLVIFPFFKKKPIPLVVDTYMHEYHELKRWFFNALVTHSQEEVIVMLLQKYGLDLQEEKYKKYLLAVSNQSPSRVKSRELKLGKVKL